MAVKVAVGKTVGGVWVGSAGTVGAAVIPVGVEVAVDVAPVVGVVAAVVAVKVEVGVAVAACWFDWP